MIKHVVNNLADGTGALEAASFAVLVDMETGGQLTATQANTVLAELVEGGGDPAEIADRLGFEAMDSGELEALVDQLIADNPAEFQRLEDGDAKIQGFFVGQIMAATSGQADGKIVNQLMVQRVSG